MKPKFWIEEKSPKAIFEAFLKMEHPKATLWDIFTDYTPIYQNQAPANKSPQWLEQQEIIIHEIIVKYCSDRPLSRQQIELLLGAIQEFTFPEDEQFLENFHPKQIALAKRIAETHILPLKMNEQTLDVFFEALEDQLQTLNKEHIAAADKEALRQNIRLQGVENNYSKERIAQMLQNVELLWVNTAEEKVYEEDDFEVENIVQDDFIYPQISLTVSNTFYGFNNDAGNLSYEEQETFANEKFEQYKKEVSELLGQQPDGSLQPKLDFEKIEANQQWGLFEKCIEANPFMYEFEGDFAAWKKDQKVLFLSVNKEDKELPYLINLGGLPVEKYKEVLEKYNQYYHK